MGLTNTQYDTIMRDYQRQQARDHDEHARRQAAVYEKIPEFAQIDAQIASASTACARRMLLDGDVASSASEKNATGKNSRVLCQLRQILAIEDDIRGCAISDIQDDRSIHHLCSLQNRSCIQLMRHVGGGNAVVLFAGSIQHLFHCYEHKKYLPFKSTVKSLCCFTKFLYPYDSRLPAN